uniref:(northern house mosquito) hypothetical protein n=1 Tax=Culex pipiens TaxID=7175 RepID=A0A8D8PH90_CULPI
MVRGLLRQVTAVQHVANVLLEEVDGRTMSGRVTLERANIFGLVEELVIDDDRLPRVPLGSGHFVLHRSIPDGVAQLHRDRIVLDQELAVDRRGHIPAQVTLPLQVIRRWINVQLNAKPKVMGLVLGPNLDALRFQQFDVHLGGSGKHVPIGKNWVIVLTLGERWK